MKSQPHTRLQNPPSRNKFTWWMNTTIYQIYPRSYQDSNGDGIGDINGILARLDYIQALGFETIWLSPFFASPQQDGGYDISDYYAIAPEFGDQLTVDRLITEVHKRGMYILFDLVLNHTSAQHPWFLESARDRTNPKQDWYIWHDGRGKGQPPNHWQSMLGRRGWHYSPLRDQWYFASFLPFQPDLNYRNPAVKEAMFTIVRHWLDQGVDGFRLDIFNVLYKDDELRENLFTWNPLPREDNPAGGFRRPLYTANRPETIALARELRALIDTYSAPPRLLLGEVFGPHETIRQYLGTVDSETVDGGTVDSETVDSETVDSGTVDSETVDGSIMNSQGMATKGLNLIFLFDLLHFRFTAAYFREKLAIYEQMYAPPLVPTYVFSNHDVRRSIERINGDQAKAKLLALFQFTVRGVAVTYQGEEIGMTDTPLPKATALDPVSHLFGWVPQWLRRFIPQLLNRDECRTPMQWSDEPNSGFTTADATPWLPLNPNYGEVNVAMQEKEEASLLNTYRRLLALRREYGALRWGQLEVVNGDFQSNDLLIYRRTSPDETLTIFINFSRREHHIPTVLTKGTLIFTTDMAAPSTLEILQPRSGMILC